MSFEGLNQDWRETTATLTIKSSKKYIATNDDDDIVCNDLESDWWVCCMNEKHECMFSRKGKYLTVVGDKLVMVQESFKPEDFSSLVFKRELSIKEEEHLIHSKSNQGELYVSTGDNNSGFCLCLYPTSRENCGIIVKVK